MYYASPTPDKAGSIYIPGQAPAPYATTAQVAPPAGFAPAAQQVLPNGLTATSARYAHHAPQAFAVVSTPAGHPAYAATNVYSSLPYHPGVATGIPTSSHAAAYHLPAAQFHPGGIGYHPQTAALAAAASTGRSGHHHPPPQAAAPPPQHYALQQPVQAGAPLFAAGYSPLPAGATMATANPPGATRTIPLGPAPMATATAGAAAFPPGFAAAFPGASSTSEATSGPPQVAYAPAGYVAQF